MTVERLLNPESPPAGHRVQEPKPINSAPRTIAGKKALKQDLGHRNWNQTIHHLFERRNDIRSSLYKEVPAGGSIELDPARLGSYTLRLEGGASIALKNPPRVPSGQGSGRTRWWSIRVRAFYATEATIAWPANVFGARGVALAPGTEGGYSLDEVSALPGQPGAAGTSDVFDLMYDERTGEWFVSWHVRAAETADPSAKNPDAVDPGPAPGEPTPPGTQPGEPTDPNNPPDGEYTDPVTGEPVAPEQPVEKAGNLVALHDGAVSFSGDCGQWWQLIGGAPEGAADIASLAGIGTVVRTEAGSAFFSRNLQSWTEIDLRDEGVTDVPVLNAGFEDGLAGWIEIGAPMAADTAQPPQKDGLHYLTGIDGDPFEVEQEISAPAGNLAVAVDAWVAADGTGSIEVIERMPVPEILSGEWSGNRIPGYAQAPDGEILDLHLVKGDKSTFTTNGNGGYKRLELRRQDGAIYEGIAALTISDLDGHEHIDIPLSAYVGFIKPESSRVYDELTFDSVRFTAPNGVDSGGYLTILFQTGNMPMTLEATASSIGIAGARPWFDGTYEQYLGSISVTDTGGWVRPSMSVATSGGPIIVKLSGSGEAFLDNVAVTHASSTTHRAEALCRDLINRRHLMATATAILARSGSSFTKIADAPIVAVRIAAHGEMIVLADAAGQIALSEDSGISWTTHATSKPVRQLFAHPAACGMLDDGTVVTISSAGVQECSTHPANSWMTWAARAQRWLLTYPYGSVYSSEDLATWTDLPDMPVSSQAGFRRFIAADIGRRIGWPEGSRDMFMQDAGQEWSLVPRLAAPIIAIEEIK